MTLIVLDMMKFNVLIVLIALLSFSGVIAQNKNEKEFRISMDQYPKNTQIVLLNIPKNAKRIRHYQETDEKKLSYESKFKFKKYWFSVEFNSDGVLEDIEKTIKEKELEKTVKEALYLFLETQASKYSIIKIQEQYLYSSKILEVDFLNAILRSSCSINSNYEIIIAIKSDKEWQLKEMTFDSNGRFLNARHLQPDSYEYIMY
ncbi:MAG: hypothetical protein ACJAZK_001467 [Psychroserpens sp.]|jgi:hypothetical protein